MTIDWKEVSNNKNVIWKPEDIITSEDVIKENIVPYGNSQDQLVPGLHYPKPSKWWTSKIWHFTISGTGSKIITWIGFKPSNIQIISNLSGGTWPIRSIGMTDGTNMYNTYEYNTTTGMKTYYVSTSVVFIEDGSSGTFYDTTATITSFDADWFTLNVTNKTLAGTVDCTYIAFQ